MTAGGESRRRVLGSAEHGQRLDLAMVSAFARDREPLSRRRARKLIEQGSVYLDRQRVRVASRAVRRGALLEISEEREPSVSVPELGAGCILFEDEHLLAVDKPAGLPTQATRGDAIGHLLSAVEALLHRRDGRVGLLALHHRLDRGTSGVVVMARSTLANRALATAFAERRLEKVYRALVSVSGAAPPAAAEWSCQLPLSRRRSAGGRPLTVTDPAGKVAVTDFTWLGFDAAGRGVVEARPRTGRTHQLRVHLAAAGLPVVGDRLYGPSRSERAEAGRLWLHAWRLGLPHPARGERLEIVSPLPEELTSSEEASAVSAG